MDSCVDELHRTPLARATINAGARLCRQPRAFAIGGEKDPDDLQAGATKASG
jgi:hypothetical protein